MSKTLHLSAAIDPPEAELTLGHYALLGLLRLSPTYGYQLVRHFREGSDLGLVLPLDMNAVYALLRDLQAQYLIVGHQEATGVRPARTVFKLTEAAQAGFLDWLAQPVERLREVRSAFLVKLYFCRELGPGATTQLLDGQLQATREYLERNRELLRMATLGSFARSVYESKLSAAEATLVWLNKERGQLHQGS